MIIFAAFSVTASAESYSDLDTKVGDVKLYADKESVELGEMVTVTIYLENVTASDGVITFDWPLTYDKSKLSFIKIESIYPESWGPYGEFLSAASPDQEYPWILRSVNDAGDMLENKAYRVKADKQIGFKLVFKAVGEGDAFVAVEDQPTHAVMLVVYDDKDVYNYGANGMKLTIKIGQEDDSSAVLPPDDSGDPSQGEASEPVGDPSEDVSVDDTSADTSVDVSGDNSSEIFSSEDVSVDESSVQDESSEESAEASSDDSKENGSSEDGSASAEQSETSGDNGDKGKSGSSFPLVPVIIAVAALAVAGVGAFFYVKKSKENS